MGSVFSIRSVLMLVVGMFLVMVKWQGVLSSKAYR